MKHLYLCLASFFLATTSFGQTQQTTVQPAQEEQVPIQSNPITISNHGERAIPAHSGYYMSTSPLTHGHGHSHGHGHGHNHVHNDLDYSIQDYASRGLLQEYYESSLQGAQGAAFMNFPETPGVNEIAVIFHVVHNPSNPAQNVSNGQIMAVFQELQEDFLLLNSDAANARTGLGFTPANSNINFCLATQDPNGVPLTELGVVRVSNNEDFYDHANGEESKMKSSATGGSDIWDRNRYLNIWICNISNGASSGVAGYAYRPTPTLLPSASLDGIVLDYNLGMTVGFNVLTHEVGHYLGLDHTWGGSGSCSSDDGFTDTPNTDGPSDNNPAYSCGVGSFQTCGVEVQYENYMDYATGCTVMFTQEQANYMLSILQGIRGSLLLSPGCDPTNTPPNSAFTSFPTGPAPVIIPQNASVNFYDESTNVPTGWTWTISGTQGVDWDWIGGTNANTQDPVAEFYTVGTYDVTLTASNGFGVDPTPASEPMYVEVAPAATGIGCDTLRNYIPADPFFIATVGAGNYTNGHQLLGGELSLEWAERHTAPATTEVQALELAIYKAVDDGGNVTFKVYPDGPGGVPGAVPLATETVPMADLNELAWNYIQFTTPATVTGNFWVGFELDYSGSDTLALFTGADNNLTQNHTWVNRQTSGWQDISTLLTGGPFYAGIVDVLTSSGGDPSMTFTATADSVCQGGDILVDGSGSTNNQDYRWYIDDSFPGLSNPVLDLSLSSSNTFNFPYAPGTYYMYLFGDGSCITDAVYMPVEVLAPVSATVTPTATTCGNNNGSITVTGATGGTGTFFYSLDGTNYQTSNTFTNLAPGSYDVYVATNWDNCVEMYTVNVATSTPATATVSPNQSICPGGTVTLTATGGGTYNWSDGATGMGTSASINVSPANSTQYSCLVTDGFGCQTTVYTDVNVNVPIPPTITPGGSTTICAGSSVNLTSSTPTGNLWSTSETSSTITVTASGSYTVTSNDVNGCEATSAPIVVTVNPAPSISAGTVNDPSACATATGSIQVTGPATGDISWTGTSSGNSGGTVSLPYTIPNLGAGSYNITLVDGNGCTSNLLTQGLNDPNPPATPTISNSGALTFCDGGSVVLTSSYSGSGNTWTTGATTDNITVTTSQTISVTYTDGSGCSSTSTPITVTVNPNPSAPTITPSGSTTICDGETVTLSSSQGTGNVWSTGATTQDIDVSTAGTIDVVYTDANGCSATSAPITITVNPLPSVSLTALSDVCDYTPAFSLTGGTPTGGTYSGTGVTGGQFDPATAGLGTHTITYEYTDGNGCTNSATQDIFVDECLSVNEITQPGLMIYPNPTNDVIFVELSGEFDFTVHDARGRLIAVGSGTDKVSIPLQHVETGVYLINVTDKANDSVSTTRVVKQ